MRILKAEKPRLISQIERLKADNYAKKMWEKGVSFPILVYDVPAWMANIIKQEAIASGIDAAVAKGTVNCSVDKTDVLILGSRRGVRILADRLARQGVSLPFLAEELKQLLISPEDVIKMKDRVLSLKEPVVMGILNVTPDSFSDGGKYCNGEQIEARIKQIFDEGGTFIDIGAVSTRPGYVLPTVDEEQARLRGVVALAAKVAQSYGGFISVDTFRTPCARLAVEEGADLINDQRSLEDEGMSELCAAAGVGVCVMHTGGGEDIIDNIQKFYEQRALQAINSGIDLKSIVFDPGFGFGKTVAENYEVLRYLSELCAEFPQLVGMSKKSMVGAATGEEVAGRGPGTVAADTVALCAGAKILRTHDVRAAVSTVNVYKAVFGN